MHLEVVFTIGYSTLLIKKKMDHKLPKIRMPDQNIARYKLAVSCLQAGSSTWYPVLIETQTGMIDFNYLSSEFTRQS